MVSGQCSVLSGQWSALPTDGRRWREGHGCPRAECSVLSAQCSVLSAQWSVVCRGGNLPPVVGFALICLFIRTNHEKFINKKCTNS